MRMNMRRLLAVLSVFLLVCMIPAAAFAEGDDDAQDSTEVDYTHVLAFGSDVRGEFGKLTKWFSGLSDDLEYVSLLGDMVEAGPDGDPAYSSGDDIFENIHDADPDVLPRFFSIIAGDHDGNAIEDLNFIKSPDGYTSEEIYKGVNSDGSTAYYIFCVGYDAMTAGNYISYDTAELFKYWVSRIETTIPVFVVSHAPIFAGKGDNNGACFWNEALNYAATGVKGIETTADEAKIIRNVIFLSGHNVTSDRNEYVYEAGTTMPVQIDCSEQAEVYSEEDFAERKVTVYTTDVTDSELPAGQKAQAKSVMSNIYYTAVTAGYLKENGNVTTLTMSEKDITIEKVNEGKKVSLGVNGNFGKAMGNSITLQRTTESDEGGPVITKQPESVVVSYPDGATFHVEVEHPEDVASYQWYMLDIQDSRFIMDGVTGNTDTLVVPSTQRMDNDLRFYCLITNKEGLRTASHQATLMKDNKEEIKPVLYVCEYALEPGESIDLSSVDLGNGTKFGKGTVAYDSNGLDIRIKDLYLDNSNTTAGLATAPNVGITMEWYQPGDKEINVFLEGENTIYNTYYNFDYNVGGIPFDFYFNGEGLKPLVTFSGDGSLHITNGTIALRVIGDLLLDVDVKIDSTAKRYGCGIAAQYMKLGKGRKFDFDINGYAFNASGNLFTEDNDIKIVTNIPRVSVGTASLSIMKCGGVMSIENTRIDMDILAEQNVCGQTAGNNAIISDGDLYISDNSSIDIKLEFNGSEIFAGYIQGMAAYNAYIEDSDVKIELDSDRVIETMGTNIENDLEITDSTVDINFRSNGTVYGIGSSGAVTITDSEVNVSALNHGDYPVYFDCGLACATLTMDLKEGGHEVNIITDVGEAIACDLGLPVEDDQVGYDEDYVPSAITISEDTLLTVPEEYDINRGSYVMLGGMEPRFAVVETVYSREDHNDPAVKVSFASKAEAPAEEPDDPEKSDTKPDVKPDPKPGPDTEPQDETGPDWLLIGVCATLGLLAMGAATFFIVRAVRKAKKQD